MIEVENPYGEAGEFKITILESNNRYGVIKNPYNKNAHTNGSGGSLDEMMSKQSTSSLNNESQLKQQSKSTVESNSNNNNNNNNSNSKFSFKSNSRTKANKSPTKRVKINEANTTDKQNGEFCCKIQNLNARI